MLYIHAASRHVASLKANSHHGTAKSRNCFYVTSRAPVLAKNWILPISRFISSIYYSYNTQSLYFFYKTQTEVILVSYPILQMHILNNNKSQNKVFYDSDWCNSIRISLFPYFSIAVIRVQPTQNLNPVCAETVYVRCFLVACKI